MVYMGIETYSLRMIHIELDYPKYLPVLLYRFNNVGLQIIDQIMMTKLSQITPIYTVNWEFIGIISTLKFPYCIANS